MCTLNESRQKHNDTNLWLLVLLLANFFLSSIRTIAHTFMNSFCLAIVETCKLQLNFACLNFNWYQSMLLRENLALNWDKPLVGEFRDNGASITIPYCRGDFIYSRMPHILIFTQSCLVCTNLQVKTFYLWSIGYGPRYSQEIQRYS